MDKQVTIVLGVITSGNHAYKLTNKLIIYNFEVENILRRQLDQSDRLGYSDQVQRLDEKSLLHYNAERWDIADRFNAEMAKANANSRAHPTESWALNDNLYMTYRDTDDDDTGITLGIIVDQLPLSKFGEHTTNLPISYEDRVTVNRTVLDLAKKVGHIFGTSILFETDATIPGFKHRLLPVEYAIVTN